MIQSYFKKLLLLVGVLIPTFSLAQQVTLNRVSTYATGVFDEGAAEIAAYDKISQRVFYVNADSRTIDVLDYADPTQPTLLFQIDVSPYGKNANSVDVANGVLAAAIENDDKQAEGQVVLFDADGNLLKALPAGALPDALRFSPDGQLLLVANEGEPDDDYVIDPEGSVTLVNLSGGAAAATATQIDFTAFNDKKASLQNRGVRIFGPGATVAQDLEPEYVAFSADGSKGFINLQENNAIAVVDIASASVVDILPLGTKDHLLGAPVLSEYMFNEIPWWPDLGTPLYGGPTIKLGGFSGMYYDPMQSTDNQLSFWVIPDRGPNESTISRNVAGTSQNLRPFKLPEYQARVEKLMVFRNNNEIHIDANPIFLFRKDGVTPISGRGNVPGFDEVPVTQVDDQ
ncbi:MAG: nuclease, partial [Bacteroidota bacterium]